MEFTTINKPTIQKIMYTISVGRYKSAYVHKFSTENESQAHLMYKALNIGNGYKKRLLLDGKVIARYIS